MADSKKYRDDKKRVIDEMKIEMGDLNDVMMKLSSILEKVEVKDDLLSYKRTSYNEMVDCLSHF